MGQNIYSLFSVRECELQYVGYTYIYCCHQQGLFLFEASGLKVGALKFVLLLLEILVPYNKILLFAYDPAFLFTL